MQVLDDLNRQLSVLIYCTRNLEFKTDAYYMGNAQRFFADKLTKACGTPVVPIYHSDETFDGDFRQRRYVSSSGRLNTSPVVAAILTDLQVVDEQKVAWGQIRQFREDQESHLNYKRLIHWLDEDLIAKGREYIRDELECRLDRYEKALTKHGIKTVLGTVSGLLAGAGVPAILGHVGSRPLWTLALEGLSITGAVTAKVLRDHISDKPEPPPEVAYVYSLKKFLRKRKDFREWHRWRNYFRGGSGTKMTRSRL